MEDDFRLVTSELEVSQCTDVGPLWDTGNFEYPLWWLLEAPQRGWELRALNGGPCGAPDHREDFKPCAVICTFCEGRDSEERMPLVGRIDSFDLYAQRE